MQGTAAQKLESSFGVLLADTLRRTDRIEEKLDDLSNRLSRRPSERSYRFFIQALTLVNEGARQRIGEIRDEFAHLSGEARISSYNDLSTLASGLDEYLERYLPQLNQRHPAELQVFAMPFTQIVKRLIPNVELLFFTWNFERYKAQAYDLVGLSAFDPHMARSLRLTFGGDIKFVQLLHPMLREQDPFHFAVFAHEVAHIALDLGPDAWNYQLGEEKEENTPALEEPTPLNYAETVASELEFPGQLTEEQEKQLISWFFECACDIFAMRIVGPAFALAYAEVTSANRPLEPEPDGPRSHPPPRLRFAALKEELARFDLGQYQSELHPHLERCMSSYSELMGKDDLATRAETWLPNALNRFRQRLKENDRVLRHQEYPPNRLREDLPLIFDLADRDVPPVERMRAFEDGSALTEAAREEGPVGERELPWSEPFDWRSILNGMRLWHLRKWGPPPASLGDDHEKTRERAEHRARAARLALGGVELSEFQRRASSRRGEVRAMRPVDGLGTG